MARILWYAIALAIGVVSVWASITFQVDAWLKQMIALPAVGALFACLFQLLRDSAAAQNERLKQDRDQAFTVAATSHMAETLFDKHVEFAEAYIAATQDALGSIFRDGPTTGIGTELAKLQALRRKYRLWLTTSVTNKLDDFEDSLRDMEIYIHRSTASSVPEKLRTESYERAHNIFSEVLGLSGSTNKDAEAKSYAVAFDHLQDVLGITELTRRRDEILRPK